MNLNKVFILGNLTRDPELRQTPSGQTVCSYAVATNRFYNDSAGQRQKQAEFHNVVSWGRQAEVVSQYLKKGSTVLVEGRLQTRSWVDQQGVKHWKTEIVAERVELPPRGQGQSSSGGSGDSGGKAPAAEVETPVIEFGEEGEEINVKDIPF